MSEVIDLTYPGKLRCKATLAASGQELVTDAPRKTAASARPSRPPTSWPAPRHLPADRRRHRRPAEQHRPDGHDRAGREGNVFRPGPPRRPHQDRGPHAQGLEALGRRAVQLENAARLCPVKQSLHPEVEVPLEFVYP